MTVIIFLDMLKAGELKQKAFDEAASATGGPGERTYFITNYTHENNKTSFAVERTALDILDSALMSAESFIRIRKQQERPWQERPWLEVTYSDFLPIKRNPPYSFRPTSPLCFGIKWL